MRQVGSLTNEQHALLFTDYLVTQGISAHAESEDGQWVIWVRDENHLESAAETLKIFEENPADARYRDATSRADMMRLEADERRQQARKNLIEMRTRWNRGIAQRAPLVIALIGISVLVVLLTNRARNIEPLVQKLTICQIETTEDGRIRYSADMFQEVKRGQIWRTVTPIFIHFDWIHIFFNMYMLYYFGTQIESRYRTMWLGVLVLVLAVTSNVAQAYLSQNFPSDIIGRGPLFGGMSGVNYGLFGYIWMKTLYDPTSGLHVSRTTVFILLFWFFLCLGPWMSIANGAHGAGLAVGMALGYAPEFWRSMNRR